MKSTDLLIQEHKLILRSLDVLDAISSSLAQQLAVDRGEVEELLDFLRWFGDAHHQAKEEVVLFPALKAAAGAGRSVDHLQLEHGQERALIEDLERDLSSSDTARFVTAAGRLSSTLRTHIYKEDQILFETVDEVFGPDRDAAVFAALSGFETPSDKEELHKRLERLRRLEWKYLRK